jgi:hypothetical protein
MRRPTLTALALSLALLPAAAPPAAAAPKYTPYTECGADAAAIQDTVDAFRGALGNPNHGNGPPAAFGRREISWDGGDANSAPNVLLPDFFNTTAPRGLVLGPSGTQFQQSADSANDTGTPIEFGNLNPTYPDEFSTFSSPRLFTPLDSNVTEASFFVPGTNTPGVVSGFGAVFTDVERRKKTSITYYDEAGRKIARLRVPRGTDGGLCFAGALDFRKADLGVSKVRIVTGTTALGPDETGKIDVVAMDDFIYGEPQPNTYEE